MEARVKRAGRLPVLAASQTAANMARSQEQQQLNSRRLPTGRPLEGNEENQRYHHRDAAAAAATNRRDCNSRWSASSITPPPPNRIDRLPVKQLNSSNAAKPTTNNGGQLTAPNQSSPHLTQSRVRPQTAPTCVTQSASSSSSSAAAAATNSAQQRTNSSSSSSSSSSPSLQSHTSAATAAAATSVKRPLASHYAQVDGQLKQAKSAHHNPHNRRQRQQQVAPGHVRRPALRQVNQQQQQAQRQQQQAPPPSSTTFRHPERWASSTRNLSESCKRLAPPSSAPTLASSHQQHQQQRAAATGRDRWCCELPHHSTAPHLPNTRPQSNLSPLLNKIHQERNILRHKRAASSLSLIGSNSASVNIANCCTRRGSSTAINQQQQQQQQQQLSRSTRAPARAAAPLARGELVPSSQVTNSRLRQGALFARRQLHLLPACQTTQIATPPPPPPLLANHATLSSSHRVSTTTAAAARRQLQQIKPAPANQARASARHQATTATEARRRATRQVVLVRSAQQAPGPSDKTSGLGQLADKQQQQQFQLVKAEQKASHLTSSSSSLSLNAFVVKRPRQQRHSSSTSSSCSSISAVSRRWSAASSSSNEGFFSSPLSQSCTQLDGESHGGADRTNFTGDPISPIRQLVGANKTASETFAPAKRAAGERSPTPPEERTRFSANSEKFANGKPEPKRTQPEQPDYRIQSQPIEHNLLLLDSTEINSASQPIKGDSSEQQQSTELDKSRYRQIATTDGGDFTAADAVHAFSSQQQTGGDDRETNHDQGVTTSNQHCNQLIESNEQNDIIDIGCPPNGSPLNEITIENSCNIISKCEQTNHCDDNDDINKGNHNSNFKRRVSQGGVPIVNATDNADMISMNASDQECTGKTKMQNNNNNNNTLVGLQQVDSRQATNIDQSEEAMLQKTPLDLTNKTQSKTKALQEQTTPKQQPLGLHQAMNRNDTAQQPAVLNLKCGPNSEDSEQCSAIDLTSQQSKELLEELPSAPKDAPCGLGTIQSAHEIPIRLEPICDNYDLETRPFARGKFAQVKRCTRRNSTSTMTTGECYAAKCIKKRRRLVDIKHEILLEIEALKLSFETRHIVRLYEVYETPNEMILILEMAKGGELQRVLDDEEQIQEPLVRKMIDQILEGLIYLHDNEIAHLDIKPQNLLLSKPFPDGDIKLCDFGISRRITKDCEIREICGTPDYVAPEILRYDPISLATDMWSLGVLTYVLLSGYSPFGSENKQQTFCNITQATLDFPQEIFGAISSEAVDFIRKLIVREPSGRLTSRQAKNHHWISNHRV